MNKKLVLAVVIAVVVVAGFSLFISSPPERDGKPLRSVDKPVPTNTDSKAGEPQYTQPLPEDEMPANAPPRRLVGVVGGGDSYTHAVIADMQTREQKMYQVGDAVMPDDAELTEIQSDYVVLNGPDYGRLVLRLQPGDNDSEEESGTALPGEFETPELDRELEEALGPDPYRACEKYTQGGEQDACMDSIDDEIDRRIEACDGIEDTDAYLVCLDAAQALQDHPAF